MLKGVYLAKKKDKTLYFRASFTYKNKHISLGSFEKEESAHKAYLEALEISGNNDISIEKYLLNPEIYTLHFEKCISIINFRDNNYYISNPIYIRPSYFEYYLETKQALKFDVDDLFYYSNHKIMKRDRHLFVSDYGMQLSILSRYGIKSYSIPGKDFLFINNDNTDFRYKNIQIINRYTGVSKDVKNGRDIYTAKIHINGDYIIGRYKNEHVAAIAYNKAVHLLREKGIRKKYSVNYIEELTPIEYASKYNQIKISNKIRNLWRFLMVFNLHLRQTHIFIENIVYL